MPQGKGTYGSKVGRPPAKKKATPKGVAKKKTGQNIVKNLPAKKKTGPNIVKNLPAKKGAKNTYRKMKNS